MRLTINCGVRGGWSWVSKRLLVPDLWNKYWLERSLWFFSRNWWNYWTGPRTMSSPKAAMCAENISGNTKPLRIHQCNFLLPSLQACKPWISDAVRIPLDSDNIAFHHIISLPDMRVEPPAENSRSSMSKEWLGEEMTCPSAHDQPPQTWSCSSPWNRWAVWAKAEVLGMWGRWGSGGCMVKSWGVEQGLLSNTEDAEEEAYRLYFTSWQFTHRNSSLPIF